ncbi:uncharacterized protein LOC127837132 [Dreissena polymorpha]|uniref:Uncharacterized protein n=1 Tax=Dreissena polymorpha TaxID=45954 RepID=A0A9D4J3J0_DREPO|nr:uncharacterized protein LOC127837132 [Dreissena polymorpha]KAH3797075.1 hypothetical protein DPMN_150650 [Dreissena polymorpha]
MGRLKQSCPLHNCLRRQITGEEIMMQWTLYGTLEAVLPATQLPQVPDHGEEITMQWTLYGTLEAVLPATQMPQVLDHGEEITMQWTLYGSLENPATVAQRADVSI